MKSRFVLAILASVAVLLLVIVNVVPKRAGGSRGAPKVNGNVSTPSNGAAQSSGGDLLGKPGKLETVKERRERMMSNKAYRDDFKLSEQEIYLYVQAKGSNALSLVAAFESTRDKDYLKSAAEKFPSDPFVQAKALMWLDMSDEERAKMIEDFKKSAPTNAFANFLAAQMALKRGDTKGAMAELAAAKEKGYDEYDRESAQGLEDAYLFAGRPEAEAKTLGMAEITLPQLAQFKEMGRKFVDMAEKAAASGDTKRQQELLMVNWAIGQKLRESTGLTPVITELVGIAMQNITLGKWPADAPIMDRTKDDVLAGNTAARKELQSLVPAFDKWFPTAPDEEIINYMETLKTSGERQAFAWLKEKHPELALIGPPNN
ncbi:MAG TPA: hypothetical protein VI282_10725 [Verrucomicrobiae bacterium]